MDIVEQAIQAAGGPTKLAKAVGLSHSTVIGWKYGRIPDKHLAIVSRLSGIAPEKLRPDLAELLVRPNHAAQHRDVAP